MPTTFIYGLFDPDTAEIRYVGKTIDPTRRRYQHRTVDPDDQTHRARWIRRLLSEEKLPDFRIIEEVRLGEDWEEREKYWIARFREEGARLTNISPGGTTGLSYAKSPEGKAKAIKAITGIKRSPEARERMRRAALARTRYPRTAPADLTAKRGGRVGKPKLTDDLVGELREFARSGGRISQWASDHGITYQTAWQAATGDTWRHVNAPVFVKVRSKPRPADIDIEIRERIATGETFKSIGKNVGVGPLYVAAVAARRDQ